MAVVKILARHNLNYRSLLSYILKEQNEKPQIITHNLHTVDPLISAREFLENETYRVTTRSDQVTMYHEILSFSNQDTQKIYPEMLEDIGRKYIELRGNEGVYFGAVHKDRDHIHLHFCVSGTKLYTGIAMRLSKENLKELKINLQEYQKQKYPELEKSICEHGKGKPYQQNKEYYKNQRTTMKANIEDIVKTCLEKADTQKKFLELLRENKIYHYERKTGEPTGVVVENSKYRFTSLDMDMNRFRSLPIDHEEDKKALKELEDIRNRLDEHNKSRTLRFEEYGNEKIVTYDNISKHSIYIDQNGTKQMNIDEISADEKYEFDKMFETIESYENQSTENDLSEMTEEELQAFKNVNAVMEEYPDRFENNDFEIEPEPELNAIDQDEELEEEETEIEESDEELSHDDDDEMDR
jgi:hypothetical protein